MKFYTLGALILMGMGMSACGSEAMKPIVLQHPETKNIILIDDSTKVCLPLFRKAGFEQVAGVTGNEDSQ